MASDRFEYAVWRLKERNDAAALRKELDRLEGTRTGKQIVQARELLAEHEGNEATAV